MILKVVVYKFGNMYKQRGDILGYIKISKTNIDEGIEFKELACFSPFKFPSSSREVGSYRIKLPSMASMENKKDIINCIDIIYNKLLYIPDDTRVIPVNLEVKEFL